MAICAECGVESPSGFRFCGACGAALPADGPAARHLRKVVTALFCDVTGSTALGEELDPEVLRGVLNRYFAEIRKVIERHGGSVEKFIGDAVMAVFGIPRVHEDDALRAVRAAAEIRDRLPAVASEAGVTLRFRTGVNTGPVLTGEGENLAVGDAINVAARLEQVAAPGEIVLGADTMQLVRDAVTVEPLPALALKGKSEPVPAYRLLTVDPMAPGIARHLDAPLIGRERELRLLTEAWDRVVRERGCHLFTLLGMAGVGKSRLVAELLSSIGSAPTVLRGRCLHYGEGITFWPLAEALTPLGEPAARVLEHLSSGGAASAQELFWEVRRLLEDAALERPVILYVDDLHWAEPTLLDLLDYVADMSRAAPILLLCTARPELLEDRPMWAGGKFNAQTVLLEPLDANDSERLLEQLTDHLDADVRARVIAASEGNPLFLEEMVALADARGTVSVPSSIQALLSARLERLAGEERAVLERGAIEGEVFHRLAVRALADDRQSAELESRLAGLVRRELIRPHAATIPGDEAYRFRHLLIRDAAYDGLPKATRAELHERFADWLDAHAETLAEHDEIAGWHLEQAVRYGCELGRAIEPTLARRAAQHLYAAGARAAVRNDSSAARNLLQRALALSAENSLGAAIAVELAKQLLDVGEFDRIDELLARGERDAAVADLAALARFEWLIRAKPAEATGTIEARLPGILADFERRGDELGIANAHQAWFFLHWLRSRATPAAEHAALAARHARLAGDEGMYARLTAWCFTAQIYGDRPVESIAAELQTVSFAGSGPYLSAWLDLAKAELEGFSGRSEEARRLAHCAIDSFRAIGLDALAGAAIRCWHGFSRPVATSRERAQRCSEATSCLPGTTSSRTARPRRRVSPRSMPSSEIAMRRSQRSSCPSASEPPRT